MSYSITQWNPFQELEAFANRLGKLINPIGDRRVLDASSVWTPAVDVYEDDKEYHIKVEIPGVKADDFKVTVEQGRLHIAGERKYEKTDKNTSAHRIERFYGSFSRSFALPDDADANSIQAKYQDGVLNLHIPKLPAAQPRTIKVIST
ncbi:MAG: Hsp20/alpha crystallin family protein [Methylacidiphilales bacterium]|nr:Hsp20/alpha crystallin family protein [Candidatus Methylacidiphilales bacterium]MDW8349250.1 Hsp20/alpha crystallin family protein [Verrucomicrobiae bacterium]